MAESDSNSTGKVRAKIINAARGLIGKPYDELDCSHFVQQAYEEGGLTFPYTPTKQYEPCLIGKYFVVVAVSSAKPADLILYPGHVGIYDPDGCAAIETTECKKHKNEAMRILSARSGKNLGVEYGRSEWFGTGRFLQWKAYSESTSS